MNIISVNPAPGTFANGFGYFCPECGVFFSVQTGDDCIGQAEYCPYCGEGDPITSPNDLLEYCAVKGVDPVNFYHAFPANDPLPQSRIDATPWEISKIVSMVILDKEARRRVTADSTAAAAGIPHEVVAKIFDELHITESEAAA